MAEDYEAFPRIPSDAVRLLWFCDYYDMVLSGVLVHDGKYCWYQLCDGAPGVDAPARYTIHELTDAERADEERWYPLYIEHVENKPLEEWTKFYKPYGKRPDYSTRPIVGWFEME
jgi:hypothetical protein